MAKDVKLKISIDTTGIKSAIRTANEASRSIADQYIKDQQRMTRQTRIEIDKRNSMLKGQGNGGGGVGSASQMRMLGFAAQAAGFNKPGYLLRMSSAGIGAGTSGTAMLGASAALGGIAIASKLVEIGLESLASVVKSTAGAFVGAITEIGGARNLQEMIVESATNERMAASIAAHSATPVSTAEISTLLKSISSEFNQQELGKMIISFLSKRGDIGEAKELAPFMANLASVMSIGGQGDPALAGRILGQLRVQFPELSVAQTKKMTANLWAQGKSGAVNLENTESISKALGFARAVSPNVLKGANLEMGMVQAAQRYTGGQSAAQAVTGVKRIQEQLLNPGNDVKAEKMKAFFGQDYLAHDEEGRVVFRNAANTMAKLAIGAFEGDPRMRGMLESRGMQAVHGFVEGELSAQFKGKSESEKLSITEEYFRKMQESGDSLGELDKAISTVKETAEYQLKEAFNDLTKEMADELLPIIKNDLIPAVKLFTKMMIANKDKVGTALEDFVVDMLSLSIMIGTLVKGLYKLISGIINSPLIDVFLSPLTADAIRNAVPTMEMIQQAARKQVDSLKSGPQPEVFGPPRPSDADLAASQNAPEEKETSGPKIVHDPITNKSIQDLLKNARKANKGIITDTKSSINPPLSGH